MRVRMYVIECDVPGCRARVAAPTLSKVWAAARKTGWRGTWDHAHYCPEHEERAAWHR